MEQYENEVLDFMGETNLANVNRAIDLVNLVGINMPRKYTVHERIDPYSKYDDAEFERRYRLSKTLALQLYEIIDGANTLEPRVSYILPIDIFIFIVFCN